MATLKPRSISASDQLWDRVRERADEAGVSISRWAREALITALEEDGWIPGPAEPWPLPQFPLVKDPPRDRR
jgi:hypothetical protein